MKGRYRKPTDNDDKKRLVCIDFHGTIVGSNWDNRLEDFCEGIIGLKIYNIGNINYQRSVVTETINGLLLNPLTGLKHPKELNAVITDLIAKGHYVCITSFSKYPETIRIALEALELKAKHFEQISVICGRPTAYDLEVNGKKMHMETAMKLLHIDDVTQVTLVDDDPRIIEIARQGGYHAVAVSKGNNLSYFDEILYPVINVPLSEKHYYTRVLFSEYQFPCSILDKKIEELKKKRIGKKEESETKSLTKENPSIVLTEVNSESVEELIKRDLTMDLELNGDCKSDFYNNDGN